MPSSYGIYYPYIQITDANGRSASKALTIAIAAALNIKTANLPSGTTGAAYSTTLTATGGTTPYNWSITSGQLPAGLSLSASSGVISGTPTAAGTYNMGVQVSDAGGQSASKIFSVVIGVGVCLSCGSPLAVMTTSLPGGVVNVGYSVPLAATGGTTPYTWSVLSGQLPAGITLAASGVLSGMPTTAGSYALTLQVADSAGHQSSQALSMAISNPSGSLAVLTNSLHLGYINQPYDAVLTASGGFAPYLWSVTSGQLPAGLSLNATTGHINGTPTQGGQFSVAVRAVDTTQASGLKSFSLQVFEQPTDQYGGLTNLPCPNGSQPHFYTQKIGSRWHLCTPAGNAFFMVGLYNAVFNDTTADYQGIVQQNLITSKYTSGLTSAWNLNWTLQTARRMQSWGLNTVAEDSYLYLWPSATDNRWGTSDSTIPVKLPYVEKVSPDIYAMTNANGYAGAPVKDLIYGIKSTVYTGYRSHSPDLFDANYYQWLRGDLENESWTKTSYSGLHNDYLIGFDIEEEDDFQGFGPGADFPAIDISVTGTPDVDPSIHLGWAILVTAETQTSNAVYGVTYTNTTVYAKQALSNWLASSYSNNIASLNAAWGSNYSTFGTNGGWGTGTGLLDEDGTCPAKTTTCWVPTDPFRLSGATAKMQQDLDNFLYYYANNYYSTVKSTLQTAAPGFLYFGTAAVGGHGAPPRRQILQAASKYLDVYIFGDIPPFLCANCTDTQERVDFAAQWGGDKPWVNWTGFTANADSYMSPDAANSNYLTLQSSRGTQYQNMMAAFLDSKDTATGTYHIVGLQWWDLYDRRADGANYGFATNRDDPYDGISAITTAGMDDWGYPTGCLSGFGCEQASYGDFIDPFRQANLSTFRYIATNP